jgi:5-(carboxyamino)imidazole ribonucleotide synthase
LPLGDVRQHSPCVMLNILGDVWFDGETLRSPAWDQVLALPSAHLHLYGKAEPRPGRKMGHITFVASSMEQAQADLRSACQLLGISLRAEK